MSFDIHKGKYYYDFMSKIRGMEQKCYICNATSDLEPHHLRRVKKSDKAYADEGNIVLLCRHHHKQYHQHYSTVNPKTFLDYVVSLKDKELRVKSQKINELNNILKKNK